MPAFCLLCCTPGVFAQDSDTVRQSFTRKIIEEAMALISTSPSDTIKNEKSDASYEEYAGKIIRRIYVEQANFEFPIIEGGKPTENSIIRLANKVHQDTRSGIVRQHLFLRENEPLNPEKVVDNERYLRTRDFILDCRITVYPTDHPDSVDLTVITRDLFGLGGSVGGSFPTAPRFSAYHVNVDGRGQRVQLDVLLDGERSPKVGYGVRYRKSSVIGSLVDLEVGYSELNSGIRIGNENEYSFRAGLRRDLVSRYTRWAGGAEFSHNWSVNVDQKEDSIFNGYSYNAVDLWAGYNMGVKKGYRDLKRHFLAARIFDIFYNDFPETTFVNNWAASDNSSALAMEYTYYKQQYYKTRYVIAFGITEDLPYGFSLGFTGGYVRLLRLERPYGALKFRYTRPSKQGNFYEFILQSSSYLYQDRLEDIVLSGTFRYFTKTWPVGEHRLRNLLTASYTQLNDVRTSDYLRVNRDFVSGISTDSVFADQRLTLRVESTLFTTWSVLGFRMGPFASVESAFISCVSCPSDVNSFVGVSAGLRTRNENLIFGTLELRFTYIPVNEYGDTEFSFRFRQRFRLRDLSFIRAPSPIRYNQAFD